ncbi:copper amine oxidase N-terminal domain-containing protein [Paenibacillus thiaminolyticus]|uniref:copper amine oxidase N-terminal domain-containing protein n=1 Tax=Paenibacillus thiaminolyticus TaxID=49283 RepID=UPI00232F86C5|nr:copper amine oxidase N-terminal domain-containing protein [Paenibacillus thiaminolyticus]WCF08583.1 copper amine oxidase N-terminal domain-containing protein [Paenibacillus thiaminolyticus]
MYILQKELGGRLMGFLSKKNVRFNTRRLFVSAVIALLLATPIAAKSAYAYNVSPNNEYRLSVNNMGIESDVNSMIIHNQQYIPLRAFFESLGAAVEWNQQTSSITIKNDKAVISTKINSTSFTMNDVEKELASAPFLKDNTALMPVSLISELYTADTTIDEKDKRISIVIEPEPVDATEAVLHAFENHQLVALGDVHGLDQERDFIISLVTNPKFTEMVQTIIIETGNARYQDLVDRYINGADVDMEELKKVWRDLSVSGMGPTDTMSNEKLFEAVRAVNQKLPASKKLRIVLGDPPIDWNQVNTKEDLDKWLSRRDTHMAGVVEEEIYRNNAKGLVIIGSGHLSRNKPGGAGQLVPTPPKEGEQAQFFKEVPDDKSTNAPISDKKQPIQITSKSKSMLQLIDEKHPGTTYVIAVHTGFGAKNDELESKLESWAIPSIAAIKGTWIGALDSSYDSLGSVVFGPGMGGKSAIPLSGKMKEADIDGYLYLGEIDSFTITQPSPDIYKDDTYFNELNRRHLLTKGTPLDRENLLKEKSSNFLENYRTNQP